MAFPINANSLKDDCSEMTSYFELLATPEYSPNPGQQDYCFFYSPTTTPLSQPHMNVLHWPNACETNQASYSCVPNEPWTPVSSSRLDLPLPFFGMNEAEQPKLESSQLPHTDLQYAPPSPLLESALPDLQSHFLGDNHFHKNYNDTPAPSESPWNGTPATFLATHHVASPSCSDYSMPSGPSPQSSPIANAVPLLENTGSPLIKVEAPQEDTVVSDVELPRLEHSRHVSPWKVIKPTPVPLEDPGMTYLAPSPISETVDSESLDEEADSARAFSSDIWARAYGDRRKRKYTTAANARQTCGICGKLFQRRFNLTKHMETHQEGRMQPYTCEYERCGLSFARRTDLVRHEKSKHLRVRDYKCLLCHNAWFARKDTLRRHVEAGCPARPSTQKPERRRRRVLKRDTNAPSL